MLLGLGVALARCGFFNADFFQSMNRLVYWIALPSLIVARLAEAELPGLQLIRPGAALLAATVATGLSAWGVARVMRLPRADYGTLIQAAFRGNLAFIAVPVLLYSISDLPLSAQADWIALAMILLGATMIFYNLASVAVLLASQAEGSMRTVGTLFRRLITNPLLLAAAAGFLINLMPMSLPQPLLATLETIGGIAVPGSLLCIGAVLASIRMVGNRSAILAGALLKVALLPLWALVCVGLLGISGVEARIVLVFAAAPTAAVSYVMAKELGGNVALASGCVALSTLLAPLGLVLVLSLA